MATPARELELDGRTVRISSPDKLYFPELGLTKSDVADYAVAVGEGLLRALLHRPTTMERWPGGVQEGFSLRSPDNPDGEAFYQKRVPARGTPGWVETAEIRFPSGRPATEVAPADLATVLWMINLGTLRFHPWPVRASDTEAVDELRIDLDPQPGTDFADAVPVAHALRDLLADAGLTGFAKTSGGRGIHVFVPVAPCDFIAARHAVIGIGRRLEQAMPERVTTAWWKEERGERIFVDFNQMARDRTIASAYSIRPVAQARVSTPLHWDELDAARPDDFTVATLPARWAEVGDPWAGMDTAPRGDIATALTWYEESAGGEMPYPPEYPKMPGEPMRVQPSRARDHDD